MGENNKAKKFVGARMNPEPEGTTIAQMFGDIVILTVYARNCSDATKRLSRAKTRTASGPHTNDTPSP